MFENTTMLTIPEGTVTKITCDGIVLWEYDGGAQQSNTESN